MTKLYITEFRHMPNDHSINGQPQAALLPDNGTQQVALGASTRSNPMKYNTRLVRLYAVGDCHIAVGDGTVSATVNDLPIAAGQVEYFGIMPDQYIAVIEAV